VVSFQVIEHLPEPITFLGECLRILKPGGHLFLTVPFMWHIHEEPYDYFRYTKFGLRHILEKCGFIDIAIVENTGFWQTWVLKFNYHSLFFARGHWRYFWIPLWWLNQTIAPLLDRVNPNYRETASYTVLASKADV
jgi:SAM-dependent methyltransferase